MSRRTARLLLRVLLAANLVALAVLTLVSPRPRIGFQRHVYRSWPDRFVAVQLSPDSPWISDRLEVHFYRPRELVLQRARSLEEAETKRRSFIVVASAWEQPAAPGFACETLYEAFPEWQRRLRGWSPYLRVEGFGLHRCRRLSGPDAGAAAAPREPSGPPSR